MKYNITYLEHLKKQCSKKLLTRKWQVICSKTIGQDVSPFLFT
jgi:hypothetical protein